MEIIQTSELSKEQKTDVLALVDKLKKAQGLTLSFPFEDASSIYLLYQTAAHSKELAGVLALITDGEDNLEVPIECAAFTALEYQRSGCFSALFQAAEEEFEDCDLIFYVDNTNEGALKTLESLEAERDYDEYRMEFSLTDTPIPPLPEALSLSYKTETVSETGDFVFTVFDSACSKTVIGSAHGARFGNQVCLYGFEILKEYRRSGYGRETLLLFLTFLHNAGIESVFLHVSGENEVALHLYEKTGFRITETLSCYLY